MRDLCENGRPTAPWKFVPLEDGRCFLGPHAPSPLAYAAGPLTRERLLLAHLDYAWDRVRPALDGLSDDEYFWEPVPGCWTVRRRDDGSFIADWAWPEPNPAPFTTIAWRLSHIGFFLNVRADHLFRERVLSPRTAPWPGSAMDAVEWVVGGFENYRSGMAAVGEAGLDRKRDSAVSGLDARSPLAMNLQHITLELIHHGAEVSLLRDLYRARGGAM